MVIISVSIYTTIKTMKVLKTMKTLKTTLFFITTLFISAYAEEDDYLVGEIVTDFVTGAVIARCQSFYRCNLLLTIVVCITLISIPVCLCAGIIDIRDICTCRNLRSCLTTSVGYGITTAYLDKST